MVDYQEFLNANAEVVWLIRKDNFLWIKVLEKYKLLLKDNYL